MGHKTPLYTTHESMGAKLVDFGGWDMPLHYGSQIEEHHSVRQKAGMFDVSHMTIVDIHGPQALPYLQYLLANDVARIAAIPGKALYSAMLNPEGGVIDDLIVYHMGNWFRTVVNCGTREKDLAWMNQQAENFDVSIEERPQLAMIAVQGPEAVSLTHRTLTPAQVDAAKSLAVFQGVETGDWFIARTGYTGEDGYEIMLPAPAAESFWRALAAAGVAPCGLGARDTLRLEAGMNLYGNDMDEQVSPLQANMGWTVAWEPADRDFIGRAALQQQRTDEPGHKLVGLVLEGRGVLRAHQAVHSDKTDQAGEVTSGTFSPTLGVSIALARVPIAMDGLCEVEIRHKRVAARIVKPCFVRNGQSLL